MTPGEEIKLNDFRAHKASIISEIRVKSAELSELLIKVDAATSEYSDARTKKAAAEKAHAALLVWMEAQKALIAEGWEALTAAQEEWEDGKSVREEENRRLLTEKEELVEAIRSLDEEKKTKEEGIIPIRTEYATAVEERDAVIAEIAAEKNSHEVWRRDTKAEQDAAEIKLNETRKETDAEAALLGETREQVAEEQKKILLPEQKLKQELAEIARMRGTLDIYYRRVKWKHEQLYPGRPFEL